MAIPLVARRVAVIRAAYAADACWPWDGTIHCKGYGLLHGGAKAHREAYTYFVGPIPDGAVIDHECHNLDPDCRAGCACPHRRCVNPAHLIARTGAENTAAGFATRATCRNGHPRNPQNTRHVGGKALCGLCGTTTKRDSKRRARRTAGIPERRDDRCQHGHEFTEENTYHYVREGKPRRMCRTCKRARENAAGRARRRRARD